MSRYSEGGSTGRFVRVLRRDRRAGSESTTVVSTWSTAVDMFSGNKVQNTYCEVRRTQSHRGGDLRGKAAIDSLQPLLFPLCQIQDVQLLWFNAAAAEHCMAVKYNCHAKEQHGLAPQKDWVPCDCQGGSSAVVNKQKFAFEGQRPSSITKSNFSERACTCKCQPSRFEPQHS